MNDHTLTAPEDDAPAAVTTEPNDAPPEVFDLPALQELSPAALHELCARFDFHPHSGRTRHQLLVDLMRHLISRGQVVRTNGFLELPNDGPAMLRSPSLNFLPVPEDVGVPQHLIRHFGLRAGQALNGTVRLPRDREKSLMLDRGDRDRRIGRRRNGRSRLRSTI